MKALCLYTKKDLFVYELTIKLSMFYLLYGMESDTPVEDAKCSCISVRRQLPGSGTQENTNRKKEYKKY